MEATTDEITQFTSSDSSPLKVMNRRRLAEREQESVAIEHTSEDSQGGEEDCARGVTVPTRAKSPSVPYTRNGQEYLRHRPGDVKYGRLTELVYPPLEVTHGAPTAAKEARASLYYRFRRVPQSTAATKTASRATKTAGRARDAHWTNRALTLTTRILRRRRRCTTLDLQVAAERGAAVVDRALPPGPCAAEPTTLTTPRPPPEAGMPSPP
eukprot:CAMPEP_0119470278 /NCGR_PEP_ID=MMETSP1344-20130328/3246_1 /TAXON_ID=236787 /ORGANISM="Florenciella parvula, Strain CCMP2471" /LENGTH=210 /DNA_ID=CAMNT_0007502931 /DNA_START=203 /DNA_END=832 /DNA_ORIENTATION=-